MLGERGRERGRAAEGWGWCRRLDVMGGVEDVVGGMCKGLFLVGTEGFFL